MASVVPMETETEIIRRQVTPSALYWTRWAACVGGPTLLLFKNGSMLMAARGHYDFTDWVSLIVDVMVTGALAQAGFMDRLWGRRSDERNGKITVQKPSPVSAS
jgi:hypothetical protein